VTLPEIADLIHARLEAAAPDGGPDIKRVAKIEEAGAGDITFLSNPKYAKFLATTSASAVIVAESLKDLPARKDRGPALLRVRDPYLSFVRVLAAFNPPPDPVPPGIHPSAHVAASARLGRDVRIGAHALVGERADLGDGAMIGAGAVVGDDVTIGPGTLLYPHVTVRERCKIGARVILQPGAVVGSDGFGFAPRPDGSYDKIPQMGIVVIEDDAEIGANTTIDRATLGETRIGKGVKLDNLVQIAHNVTVGPHTVIAAQSGIAGSTRIGAHCVIAGQVGIVGHLEIADRTTIAAQSGIHRAITKPGESWFGTPALPYRQALRVMGSLGHLPEIISEIRALKLRLEELRGRPGVPPSADPTTGPGSTPGPKA
jgi:UDP-3-O-[3-hydroxymyristoyl] glucosamine N-acyltransferase